MMVRWLVFIMLCCLAGVAKSASDLPVEILESHLTFKDGELIVSSDGRRISVVKLTFRGKTQILRGSALEGLEQPDLSTIQLKLVGVQRCKLENACLDYSLPLIEIKVAGIPEEPDCADCAGLITVQFLFEDGRVQRKASSQKAGGTTYYPAQMFLPTAG